MAYTIAVSGKGGTGKTTLTALMMKSLINRGKKPILAVDADANANLNEVLGVEVPTTVGQIREATMVGVTNLPASMTKGEILDTRIQQSLIEAVGYDLLVMGRPEGPGCYCFANNLIREIIDRLGSSYPYIVIDNEAGMEHLSRRTTQEVDVLLVVTDPIKRGVLTAKRVIDLTRELNLRIGSSKLVFNRVNGELPSELLEYVAELGLEVAVSIPEDKNVCRMDALGSPTFNIEENSEVFQAVDRFIATLVK